ncbi:MAG: hypothetical protein ACJAYX_003862, partial [Planctomycetota bacterium]
DSTATRCGVGSRGLKPPRNHRARKSLSVLILTVLLIPKALTGLMSKTVKLTHSAIMTFYCPGSNTQQSTLHFENKYLTQ